MQHRPSPRSLLIVALTLASTACTGGPAVFGARVAAPAVPIVAWAGPVGALFEDGIDPAALNLAAGTSPRADLALRERVLAAEAVVRVRVSTVSLASVDGRGVYQIALKLVGEPLVGAVPTDEDHVDVSVAPGSAAFPVVRSVESSLVGRTFVGFFRRFAGPDQPVLRFHLARDGEEMAAAVHEVVTLSALSGR